MPTDSSSLAVTFVPAFSGDSLDQPGFKITCVLTLILDLTMPLGLAFYILASCAVTFILD